MTSASSASDQSQSTSDEFYAKFARDLVEFVLKSSLQNMTSKTATIDKNYRYLNERLDFLNSEFTNRSQRSDNYNKFVSYYQKSVNLKKEILLLNNKCVNLKKRALELKANCETNKSKEVIQKQKQLEEEQKLYPKLAPAAPPPLIAVQTAPATPIPIPSSSAPAAAPRASPRSPSSFIDVAASKSPETPPSVMSAAASVTSDNGELKVESRVKMVRKVKHPKAKPNEVLLDGPDSAAPKK